jgi:hypothetical protein
MEGFSRPEEGSQPRSLVEIVVKEAIEQGARSRREVAGPQLIRRLRQMLHSPSVGLLESRAISTAPALRRREDGAGW